MFSEQKHVQMAADGKLEKMEKDWSVEVAAGITKSAELVKVLFKAGKPLSFPF
jgi:hypothetical protein